MCSCVSVCALCVCSHCTPVWHRARKVGKWAKFPEAIRIFSSMPLAFIYPTVYHPVPLQAVKHTQTHSRTHTHTHSLTPVSPSIHLLDMIVPLLLLYVLIHQLWVKRQLHPAIDAASRQSQNYGMVHYCKLLLKFLFFYSSKESKWRLMDTHNKADH